MMVMIVVIVLILTISFEYFSNNDDDDDDDEELCRMLLATMIPMHSLATGLLKLPHLDAVRQ